MKTTELELILVETFPCKLEEGKLYFCEKYEIAVHLCACGCGKEVVTPTSIGEWTLTRRKEGVSLTPSVGNRFSCMSHYYITDSKIKWC